MRRARMLFVAAAALALTAPASARTPGDPVPRFEDAICPGVAGMQVDAAEMLVYRIRQNAEALHRWLAPPETCKANLIVSFVNDGQQIVRELIHEKPYLFSEVPPSEREARLAMPGPVHVVSNVVTRTRDGMPVYGEENLNDPPQVTAWMAHSKIYSATRRDIIYVLVLIDQRAVRGMSLTQLADYVTMRALVHDLPDQPAANSILTLFSAPADNRPAGLTSYDQALLSGLYEGIPNLNGRAREATMEHATGRGTAGD